MDNESNLEPIIRFIPIHLFSRQAHLMLNENGGRIPLLSFETCYLERFGVHCRPSTYGHSSILALLQAIPHLIVIRGRGPRRMITLHKEIGGKDSINFFMIFKSNDE